jgi:hypothetical protein
MPSVGRRFIMADNNKNEQAEEIVLGTLVMKPTFDFRAALKKAKKKAVDCGIFASPEQKKDKK